jgi:hypothetical protein
MPIIGENSQPFVLMNRPILDGIARKGRNPPFFKTGMADAMSCASGGMVSPDQTDTKRNTPMTFNIDRFFAAAFAVALSAVAMATAIVPATPTLIV